jgi:hypothetical protein
MPNPPNQYQYCQLLRKVISKNKAKSSLGYGFSIAKVPVLALILDGNSSSVKQQMNNLVGKPQQYGHLPAAVGQCSHSNRRQAL